MIVYGYYIPLLAGPRQTTSTPNLCASAPMSNFRKIKWSPGLELSPDHLIFE